ncbi:MAG: TolC family protein [Balneolaceae bacterium]|nr:TolC family protein [Balneolaceae bacterium]
MNRLTKTAWLGIVLSTFALPSIAQMDTQDKEGLLLSLEEALNKASSEGYEVRLSRQQQRAAKAGMQQANAVFLPRISIEEAAVKTNDPIGVFGIKLRQGIITQADFAPANLNAPDATHNFTTKVEVVQPILNAEGLFKRSASTYQYTSAASQLNATLEYTKLKVKELYYQLSMKDLQLEVLEKHLATTQAFKKQVSDYMEQGMVSKAEYLQASVSVLNTERELLKAKNQRDSVNDRLLMLMGMKSTYTIQTTNKLETAASGSLSLPEEYSNSSLLALENRMKASGQMLKAAKSGFLPTLTVFGAYELHASGAFGNDADNYMVGASLKWDLFKGMKQTGLVSQRKAELKQSELQYEQHRLQHEFKINEARRSLGEALQSVELMEASIEQSEEDLRIRNDRYQQGLEKTADVLLAETKNLENKLRWLQALYQYHISIATLEYLLEEQL